MSDEIDEKPEAAEPEEKPAKKPRRKAKRKSASRVSKAEVALSRDFVKELVQELLEGTLPAAIAAGNSYSRKMSREEEAAIVDQAFAYASSNRGKVQVSNGIQCPECHQPNMACRGRHRLAVVFIQDEDYAEWFQGVWINGICYKSQDGQPITVPADAQVEYLAKQEERRERYYKKTRSYQGNGAGRFNQVNADGKVIRRAEPAWG